MGTPAPVSDQYQYIKLPDGSYGKFAANAGDDVIRGAIQKDFPNAFKASAPAGLATGQSLPGLPTHETPALGLQGKPVAPTTSGNAVQNSFDNNTRTNPDEPLLETGLKSVVHAVGSPFLHPISTAMGAGKQLGQAMTGNYLGASADLAEPIVQDYQDAGGGMNGARYAGTKLAGNTFGGVALGAAGGAVAGEVPQLASDIRASAIGDPNAAALRGMRIPSASQKVLPTIRSIEGARPFLQGANSLEDLQARIPAAKNEVWSPYTSAIDQLGERPINGPDGPTTANQLEQERQQLSALNRGIKSGSPEALQLAQQKGMSSADLLAREQAVTSALDPEIAKMGVDPLATRKAFGNIAQIGSKVSGRSTLLEPDQNYGFSRLGDVASLKGVDLSRPGSLLEPLKSIGAAGKDILAGRYWKDSPTDVAIREGFAGSSPKPSLTTQAQRFLGSGGAPSGRPYQEPFQATPVPAPLMGLPETSSAGEPLPLQWEQRTPPPAFNANAARTRVAPTQGEFNRMGGVALPSENRGLALGSPTLFPQLPAVAGGGEAEPMIGVSAPTQYPPLAGDFAKTRVQPTSFSKPQIPALRGGVVTPNGEIIQPSRLELPAKASRAKYRNQ